jgi:hypothetical protein
MMTQNILKDWSRLGNQPLPVIGLVVISFLLFNEMALAQPARNKALKLSIESKKGSIQAGDTVNVEVVLRDENNQAVVAPRDMTIEVKARSSSDSVVMKREVTIKAGSSSQQLELSMKENGIFYVWARHSELQDGGTNVLVKPQKSKPAPSTLRVVPRAAPLLMAPQTKPLLTLRHSPQRHFLADGKDRATIQAFLLNADEITLDSIRVRLFNSVGEMAPQPMVIARGEDVGTATLTSDNASEVTVEFVSATPTAEVEGERKLQIPFAPPITQLELKASPPIITLVDKSELIVRLLDEESNPTATDEQREITLAIEKGRGEIAERKITIAPGGFEGRTNFLPTWRGEVDITAATPNLPTIHIDPFKVTLPVLLLSLSAFGGLVGGLIAFWIGKGSKWWRIVIGLVAGFVLYWAFIFGVLTALPRAAVLNPLSAFVLSTLGGWLGTEVFNQILKRLGLVPATQAASK